MMMDASSAMKMIGTRETTNTISVSRTARSYRAATKTLTATQSTAPITTERPALLACSGARMPIGKATSVAHDHASARRAVARSMPARRANEPA